MQIGETGSDICPKHEEREDCKLVAHSHLDGFCYRTFKAGCGCVYAIENYDHHCSEGGYHATDTDHG
jgi:hypothetical protein